MLIENKIFFFYERLFLLLRQKYISLNRFSGTVVLQNVTEIESKDLTNFFGERVPVGSDFKTSFAKIEKNFEKQNSKILLGKSYLKIILVIPL